VAEPAGTRIVLLDDDRGVAEAVMRVLEADGITVVGDVASVDAVVAAVTATQPDVVVADIDLAGELALDLPERLGPDGPPILWWSGHADRLRIPGLLAGGAGFVGKREGLASLVEAIRRVAAGGEAWTQADRRAARAAPRRPAPREAAVLARVAAGRQNKEIAIELGIQERTVESHLRRMFDRYGCSNRVELVTLGHTWGWIPGA
jgi:DNA-binding NarL/FixJ family response regulator